MAGQCIIQNGPVSFIIRNCVFRNPGIVDQIATAYTGRSEPAPPGPLYKYCDAYWAKRLREEGSVLVGTLAYYRKVDDKLRGDLHEGRDTVHEAAVGARRVADLPLASRTVLRAVGAPDHAIAQDNLIYDDVVCPDAFAYCVSSELSHAAAGNYNTCIEILDVPAFIERVTWALWQKVGNVGLPRVGRVTYRSRVIQYERYDDINPAFLKDAAPFRCEQEVRALWGSPRACDFGDGVPLVVPGLGAVLKEVPIPAPHHDHINQAARQRLRSADR